MVIEYAHRVLSRGFALAELRLATSRYRNDQFARGIDLGLEIKLALPCVRLGSELLGIPISDLLDSSLFLLLLRLLSENGRRLGLRDHCKLIMLL